MDDARARRVGKNEAVFREINERVDAINRGLADISDNRMHIICECGDLLCVDRLVVPVQRYEEIRSDPALFFVERGHDKPAFEEVVEETDGYDVVRKRPGEPQRVAEETDPRS
jgi:hypothetical protein